MKRILAWFLALIMVFGMISLPGLTRAEGEEDPDQPGSIEEIADEEEGEGESEPPKTRDGPYAFMFDFTLAVGETKLLDSTLIGEVSWSSSDLSIATVDENGLVTARSVGRTNINADGYTAQGQWLLPFWEVTVTQLTLSTDTLELPLGSSRALTASYSTVEETYPYPSVSVDVTDDCTWTSSNENILVDAAGCVSLGAGATVGMTATVTASYTPEGFDHPLHASCTVTVTEQEEEYDAFVWKLGAYVGDIQYIRYTILVNKTIADPAFSLRVGGEDRPNVATENDFYTDRLSCLWIQSGPTEVSEYPDYDQYVILVKVFAKQFNTTQTITVKNGSETVRIRSYANTGIEGVVGDCVNHSMVEQMEVYAILNYRNKAAEWRRLKAAMIELAASIAAVNG